MGLELMGVQHGEEVRPCQHALSQSLSEPIPVLVPAGGLEQDQVKPDADFWYKYYSHQSFSLFPYKDRNDKSYFQLLLTFLWPVVLWL